MHPREETNKLAEDPEVAEGYSDIINKDLMADSCLRDAMT